MFVWIEKMGQGKPEGGGGAVLITIFLVNWQADPLLGSQAVEGCPN